VFTRDGSGSWHEDAKLIASDAAAEDYFGLSVAVSGDTVVIGSWCDDSCTGSAYIFTPDGCGSWTENTKLIAPDAAAWDNAGWAIAASDDAVVIGAFGNDDAGEGSGSAYVLDLSCIPDTDVDCDGGLPDDLETPFCGAGTTQAMLPCVLIVSLAGCKRRSRRNR
jgi:hypothetical protein